MNNKKVIGILVAVIGLLVVGIVFSAIIIIPKLSGGNSQNESNSETTEVSLGTLPVSLKYESSVITSEDDFQKIVDDMVKKAEEGTMSLEYKNIAMSENGVDFSCYIINAEANSYDMYIQIYKDATLQDELYRSGLLPIGSGIDKFKTISKLESGEYSCVLVLTQIESDMATIHSQIMVELKLYVE